MNFEKLGLVKVAGRQLCDGLSVGSDVAVLVPVDNRRILFRCRRIRDRRTEHQSCSHFHAIRELSKATRKQIQTPALAALEVSIQSFQSIACTHTHRWVILVTPVLYRNQSKNPPLRS